MNEQSILYTLFVIFTGAAVLGTVALASRQALIIAYILLGVLLGPSALGVVSDPDLIADMSQTGIIFLLFLLGLNLLPMRLLQLFRETTIVTLVSSAIFWSAGFGVAWAFGFSTIDSLVIGFVSGFSSTIIGLKLLPTTVLHHRHIGEIIVSVLLLQDIIAIVGLLLIQGTGSGAVTSALVTVLITLPALGLFCWAMQTWVLVPLFKRFDRIQEFVFLVTIGWCLGVAQAAHSVGLSYEIGASMAGVAPASHPIAQYIADALRHVRDFFLVIFFFALGARMDLGAAATVAAAALTLASVIIILKPLVFSWLLRRENKTPEVSREVGVRLGQLSEFSLLMMFVAGESAIVSPQAESLVQLATVITFVVSTTWVVLKFPSPIALSDKLRRD